MLLSLCPLDSGAGWVMGADFILLIPERKPETILEPRKARKLCARYTSNALKKQKKLKKTAHDFHLEKWVSRTLKVIVCVCAHTCLSCAPENNLECHLQEHHQHPSETASLTVPEFSS